MHDLSRLLEDTFLKSAEIGNKAVDNDVKRHILFSLSNRIGILKYNYEYLSENGYLAKQKKIEDNTHTIINTHLNSIYIHISGGLDNLAWAFCYKSKLYGEIKENDYKIRNKVSLISDFFLKAIKENKYIELYNLISNNKNWFLELKKFRDPIAHRVIMLSSNLYNQNEAENVKEHYTSIDKSFEKIQNPSVSCSLNDFMKDLIAINNNLDKLDNIGDYHPIFCLDPLSNDKENIKPLKQIESDLRKFIEICNIVLKHINIIK